MREKRGYGGGQGTPSGRRPTERLCGGAPPHGSPNGYLEQAGQGVHPGFSIVTCTLSTLPQLSCPTRSRYNLFVNGSIPRNGRRGVREELVRQLPNGLGQSPSSPSPRWMHMDSK